MKAALNGVPSLSILDGWWIEGHIEGATGWAIGDESEPESDTPGEVASLYDKLERVIVPPGTGRQPATYLGQRDARRRSNIKKLMMPCAPALKLDPIPKRSSCCRDF